MKTGKRRGRWSIQAAQKTYQVDAWGAGYFVINKKGHIAARPLQEEGGEVDLLDVVQEAESRGLRTPLLIRFQDIVRHRVAAIHRAFQNAIADCEYQGSYRGVFPLKVNQLREVVEEILDAGKPYKLGLEVGSKAELFAALAQLDKIGSLVVCNGYKDATFIRMALTGLKLGKEVILVIEKLEELERILELSESFGVRPFVGVRLKLLSKGAGRWAASGGEDAKFGLSTSELLAAARLLEKRGMKEQLKLIHFHIGSQIPDILLIKRAVQEAARFYAKLRQMGFPVRYLDVGGGLGVDYLGNRSLLESSINYTLQEYANDVIYYVGTVCQGENVPHPDIITESGRAIVAYHSVLVIEALGAIAKNNPPSGLLKYGPNEHPLVQELLEIRDNLSQLNKLEAYHDALERRDDAQQMFTFGALSLETKAKIEDLYWQIAAGVVESFQREPYVPEEIRKLAASLCDQYLCNFSVFQSLLDHWALDQIFPIVPICRLNEAPRRSATLVDITCDSDGHVRHFVGRSSIQTTLPLHALKRDARGRLEPYYVGAFLIGAYQDVMGDMHNLFGRVNEAHVFLDPDEPAGYYIEEAIEGSAIGAALGTVQYEETELKRRMKAQIDAAIKSDRLKPSEAMRMLKEYEKGLREYTYLRVR